MAFVDDDLSVAGERGVIEFLAGQGLDGRDVDLSGRCLASCADRSDRLRVEVEELP